jgi:hypothetical protein
MIKMFSQKVFILTIFHMQMYIDGRKSILGMVWEFDCLRLLIMQNFNAKIWIFFAEGF